MYVNMNDLEYADHNEHANEFDIFYTCIFLDAVMLFVSACALLTSSRPRRCVEMVKSIWCLVNVDELNKAQLKSRRHSGHLPVPPRGTHRADQFAIPASDWKRNLQVGVSRGWTFHLVSSWLHETTPACQFMAARNEAEIWARV